VWPLNTVQFSNHTQYGAWEGLPTPNEQISLLVDGIAARNALGKCDALLSGYLGSAEQGGHVLEVLRPGHGPPCQGLHRARGRVRLFP